MLMYRKSTIYVFLVSLLHLPIGCEDIPQRDYDDFKTRTTSLRPDKIDETTTSTLADLRGMWLLNARLSAGIDLGLRVKISADRWPMTLSETETHTFEAKIWLDRQDPNSEDPIVIVSPQPVLNSEGRFTLTANPLVLDPEVLNVTTAVEAIVNLESSTQNLNEFCGIATGSVTVPLTLDLEGSTFGALRDDESVLTLDEVPTRCPTSNDTEDADTEDAGTEDAGTEDAGTEDADSEIPLRPELPSLSHPNSAPANVTGHWLVNVKLPVPIPLRLWASLIYTPSRDDLAVEGSEGGVIDGTLRRELDPIDAEPIIRFSSPVTADGIFEVWMPNFTLDGAISVAGDLLIGGVIIPPINEEDPLIWCGEAAGEARSPLMLDLAGTTLYAASWIPGAPSPETLLDACPSEE